MTIELFRPCFECVGKLFIYALPVLVAVRKRVRARMTSARSIHDLNDMSDRMLADIGLQRGGVERRVMSEKLMR